MDKQPTKTPRVSLLYLARGADERHLENVQRFAKAYRSVEPGVPHRLILILKGFASDQAMHTVRAVFDGVPIGEVHTSDDAFDLGAYRDAVAEVESERVAFLNSASEPLAPRWLAKLDSALDLPGVGLAGATGSFQEGVGGCAYPNVHVRTNAFMMTTALAREVFGNLKVATKRDAHLAEHGLNGLTRKVARRGLSAVIVGANGRAYAPEWWSGSRTFRQGDQANLLVADNQTRNWDEMTWPEKSKVHDQTWGASRTPGAPFYDPLS